MWNVKVLQRNSDVLSAAIGKAINDGNGQLLLNVLQWYAWLAALITCICTIIWYYMYKCKYSIYKTKYSSIFLCWYINYTALLWYRGFCGIMVFSFSCHHVQTTSPCGCKFLDCKHKGICIILFCLMPCHLLSNLLIKLHLCDILSCFQYS